MDRLSTPLLGARLPQELLRHVLQYACSHHLELDRVSKEDRRFLSQIGQVCRY